jgi:hypothetical protein
MRSFSFFGYFNKAKDSKSELQEYIANKKLGLRTEFEMKQFYTPLDVGKYKIALLIEAGLQEPDDVFLRTLYIAYKLNEFLEQPDVYGSVNPVLQSELCNRSDFTSIMIACRVIGFQQYVTDEWKRLLDRFTHMFATVTLPDELPGYLKTGSGWNWSTIHYLIKDLYDETRRRLVPESKSSQP